MVKDTDVKLETQQLADLASVRALIAAKAEKGGLPSSDCLTLATALKTVIETEVLIAGRMRQLSATYE